MHCCMYVALLKTSDSAAKYNWNMLIMLPTVSTLHKLQPILTKTGHNYVLNKQYHKPLI